MDYNILLEKHKTKLYKPKPGKLNNPYFDKATSVHEFSILDLSKNPLKLDKYEGNFCLIVNTASKCMLAKYHYEYFNRLIDKFGDKGLRILAFPCNQFCKGEPGSTEDIIKYAVELKVQFDIFSKVDVNGIKAIPLYKFLKYKLGDKRGAVIKDNYTKFLVDKLGIPLKRFGPEPNNLSDIDDEILDIMEFYKLKEREIE